MRVSELQCSSHCLEVSIGGLTAITVVETSADGIDQGHKDEDGDDPDRDQEDGSNIDLQVVETGLVVPRAGIVPRHSIHISLEKVLKVLIESAVGKGDDEGDPRQEENKAQVVKNRGEGEQESQEARYHVSYGGLYRVE